MLNVTPTTGSISIVVETMSSFAAAPSGGLFTMGYIGYEQVNYVPENVLVNLCSDNKDKYEFGFNGQMKVNEVAGVGNWNTAEFWEYNTRTGLRANMDPKVNTWESPYNTFNANPIWHSDPNGDYSKIVAQWKNFWNNGYGTHKDAKTGEWGYLPNATGKYRYKDDLIVRGTREEYNKRVYNEWLDNEKAANLEDLVFGDNPRHKREVPHKDPPAGVDPNATMNSRQRVGAILDMMSPAFVTAAPQTVIQTTAFKGFNFTKTAAGHMDDAGRMIPVQILNTIIRTPMKVLKDPQGTNALMYYSQMWKNGKLYNVEVLYDKSINTIMHFKYTEKALGPLQAIPK